MQEYIIGVDGGGSKTHAVLVCNKQIIAHSHSGEANIRTDLELATGSIQYVIDKLLMTYDLLPNQVKIGVGIAGFSSSDKLQQLKQTLEQKYPYVKFASDGHIACLAAHKAEDGAIVICGTGIVGYYIKAGAGHQIGGWGFPHGDLGGGAWLGLEICKLVCKAVDGVLPWSQLLEVVYQKFDYNAHKYKTWLLQAKPGDFATIARYLPEYLAYDRYASLIIEHGVNEMLPFIQAVIERSSNLPCKLMGGLSQVYLPFVQGKFKQLTLAMLTPALGATYLYDTFK